MEAAVFEFIEEPNDPFVAFIPEACTKVGITLAKSLKHRL